MSQRSLKPEEIQDILSNLNYLPKCPKPLQHALDIHKKNLKEKLETIKIREDKIQNLKDEIEKLFINL